MVRRSGLSSNDVGIGQRVGGADEFSAADESVLGRGTRRNPLHVHVIGCDVSQLTDPDLGTVDELARLQLAAVRRGSRVRLLNATAELRRLLVLVGLDDVLGCEPDLGIEARRQAEHREESGGVQEERNPADPIA
jgi:hypothetical protein